MQQEIGVRGETATVYLKAAGIAVQPRGRRRRQVLSPKPAISVTTDSPAKPAISVTTDSGPLKPALDPSSSICEPSRGSPESHLASTTWAVPKVVTPRSGDSSRT